jgi:orotate phosphoribosyltransferase
VACGGTYIKNNQRLAYVGETYYYFAQTMQYPYIVDHWARRLSDKIIQNFNIRDEDVYLGLPLQGTCLAQSLARNSKYTRAVQVERPGGEFASLQVKSYQVCRGDRAIIVEDIGNSFRTAAEVISQVEAMGATAIAIACVCTRSHKDCFRLPGGREIPIISLVRKEIPQYQQDDLFVAKDVRGGNVIWEPEANWEKLMAFMPQPKK